MLKYLTIARAIKNGQLCLRVRNKCFTEGGGHQ